MPPSWMHYARKAHPKKPIEYCMRSSKGFDTGAVTYSAVISSLWNDIAEMHLARFSNRE
jgi:hypothetical protein